jgi:hypothetical protein
VEACSNGSVSKVSLYGVLLLLCLSLNGIKLDPLLFDICEARVLRSQSVNICNDPRITKVKQGIVDYKAVIGGQVKDGEICVSQS